MERLTQAEIAAIWWAKQLTKQYRNFNPSTHVSQDIIKAVKYDSNISGFYIELTDLIEIELQKKNVVKIYNNNRTCPILQKACSIMSLNPESLPKGVIMWVKTNQVNIATNRARTIAIE